MRGVIVKGIAGFYYCMSKDGKIHEARARGVFRNEGLTPLCGDEVIFENGAVTEILPRLNAFDRPPVSNVELMVLTASCAEPAPDIALMDRFLCSGEKRRCSMAICISKCDLAEEGGLDKLIAAYQGVYPLIFTSSETGQGIEELKALIRGRKTAFSGASGSGKSSLINALLNKELSPPGELSKKTKRGKNTTRETSLFIDGDIMIFDTPGFTAFEEELEPSEVEGCFPELAPYLGKCRYKNCVHIKEDDCAVKDAVRNGAVSRSRYRSYRAIYLSASEKQAY